MWTYLGTGAMPECPGAPMRDLTDDEHKALIERLGAAVSGLYAKAKTPTKKAQAPKVDTEPETD